MTTKEKNQDDLGIHKIRLKLALLAFIAFLMGLFQIANFQVGTIPKKTTFSIPCNNRLL